MKLASLFAPRFGPLFAGVQFWVCASKEIRPSLCRSVTHLRKAISSRFSVTAVATTHWLSCRVFAMKLSVANHLGEMADVIAYLTNFYLFIRLSIEFIY